MEKKELEKAARSLRHMVGFAGGFARTGTQSQVFHAFEEAATALANLIAVVEEQQKEIERLKANQPR
ncbi:hypothetical protein E9536_20190 [Burkholderia sp. LS-044]|uniref:hypothetical protein n=1 Tax=Burkholderia sp. LS-044 TaxID=1459967 RepID=UPI0010A60F00|nr:hypothetical protein [Burkholderia sp. LS-044]THJ52582.1 hypothetical protein E9536_20190 [Burkholderia sp. LS-044]